MSDGTSWTPGELPDVPGSAVPSSSAPPTPDTPPSTGQLSGWEAPAPSPAPSGSATYGQAPTYGSSGTFGAAPAAGSSSPFGAPPSSSLYGPPPSSSSSPYGPPPPYGAAPYGPSPYGQPAPGQPGYQPGASPYAPYAPAKTGTDGFAIAALVFGILGGWLAFVFGGMALSRIKRSGQGGRGLAITGIVLACVWIVGGVLAAIAIPTFLHQRELADLHTSCAGGDMAACDQLYATAREGSAEQQFGDTCGGRTAGGTVCTDTGAAVTGAFTYGDDPALDDLWDQCEAGGMAACDELYYSSDEGTDYQWFGGTCGGRTDGSTECVAVTDEQGA